MLSMHDLDNITNSIKHLTAELKQSSSTPRLDAELLLINALNQPRSFLYTYPEYELSLDQLAELYTKANRRLNGEPIAYILGKKAFWKFELAVTPDTLIPRPETEHIIEWSLANLSNNNLTIADLGTGTGAIALALASEKPHWQIHAADISEQALSVASYNAKQLNINNVEFYLSDWLERLPQHQYSVIISNPPYIDPMDEHLKNLKYEPTIALTAGNNGLKAFEKIILQATTRLAPKGYIILEHGYNQADDLSKLLQQANFSNITSHCDLAKQTRFITAINCQKLP